jgi:hypothetical protein
MATHTVRDLVESALGELGVLASGETATDADAKAGLAAMNDLLDQWALEKLEIYTITRTIWTLVSGTQDYTVGTGGTVNIARPVYIDHVNFQDTSGTDDLELQMSPLTEDAWSRIPIKTLTSVMPTSWYYNPTYPLATLSLWPIPTSSTLEGVIYAPTAVTEFSTINDSVTLPPGYRRMLIKNVALDLAPSFERQPSPGLEEDARESKAAVKRANIRLMDMSVEAAALVQGRGQRYTYNILTGP